MFLLQVSRMPVLLTTTLCWAMALVSVQTAVTDRKEIVTGQHPQGIENSMGPCGDLAGYQKVSLPNIGYAFLGYDILKGYPLASASDPGFTYLIFTADYSDNFHTTDCRYNVPKGLLLLPDVSCDVSFSSVLTKTVRDFEQELCDSAKVSLGAFGVHFSASTEYKEKIRELESQNYVYIISSAYCNYYKSKLQDYVHPPFDENFLFWVKRLNNSDADVDYINFFRKFGTHFSSEITFGAKFMYQYRMSTADLKTFESQELDVTASASFAGSIEFGAENRMSSSERQMAENFLEKVEKKVISVGAAPSADAKAMTWASDVQKNPVPTAYSLEPIESLFTEINMKDLAVDYQKIHDTIKANYQLYWRRFRMEDDADTIINRNDSLLIPGWYVSGTNEDEGISFSDCFRVCNLSESCFGVSFCYDCGALGESKCSMFGNNVQARHWQSDAKWQTLLSTGNITLNGMAVIGASTEPLDTVIVDISGNEELSKYTLANAKCMQSFMEHKALDSTTPVAFSLGFVFHESIAFCKIYRREKTLSLAKRDDFETYIELKT